MNCPHCHQPTSPHAVKCGHCGGLVESADQRDPAHAIACPRCAEPGVAVFLGPAEIDLCERCGGLWFDRGEVDQFRGLSDDEALWQSTHALVARMRALEPSGEPSGYPGCPVCAEPMRPKRLGGSRGILTSTCARHGAWLDRDPGLRLIEVLGEEGDAALTTGAADTELEQMRHELRQLGSKQRTLTTRVERNRRHNRWHFFLDWFGFV